MSNRNRSRRFAWTIVLTIAALLLAPVAAASASPQALATRQVDFVENSESHLCLAPYPDHVQVTQNSCRSVQWNLLDQGYPWFKMQDPYTGKCIGVAGNSMADGAKLVLWPCYDPGNDNLIWQGVGQGSSGMWPFVKFVNHHSGKCMAVPGASHQSIQLIQYRCDGTANQKWEVEG